MIVEGRTPGPDTLTYFNRVSPGYFETMGTPLFIGRDFDERDTVNAPRVTVIGESTADEFFGEENPIGKSITKDGHNGGETFQVIGVVKDTKYRDVQEETRRTAFFAAAQEPVGSTIWYAVRHAGSMEGLVPSIREAIMKVHPAITIEHREFERQINESLMQPRVVALLSAVFGSLALLLAMVGLYGVTAYGVTGRQAEIGIRMALGAQARSVVWLVMRDVLLMLAAGMALGLAASAALGSLVTSLLFGIQANDPAHVTIAAMILAAAATVAALLPARRAAHLDPMTALREE